MFTKTSTTILLLASLATADIDPYAKLTKPPLAQNGFGYLKPGLMNAIPSVPHTVEAWGSGWIPADCKTLAENNNFSASDVQAYKVQYTDCSEPWHVCRHKDAPAPLANMTDIWGRVPVRARSWIRHIINLPDPSGTWAYNSGGNIVFFDNIDYDLTTFIHETSHSLDTLGAYQQQPHVWESTSQNWLDNYNQDDYVPDSYSQHDMLEDVAQNSVVAAYNLNVPGGFPGVEPQWQKIFHQYATIETVQRNAGNLLVAGGSCGKRLNNSEPVQVGTTSRVMRARDLGEKPNVSLGPGIEVIEGKEFSTEASCNGH